MVTASASQGSIELIGDAPSKCMTPTLATTASKSLTKFLDVRRQDEFDLGHCTGISHVVWDGDACWQRGQSDPACAAFIQGMEALVTPADGLTRYATPIFIHCKSGSRAGQVAKFLQGRNWTQTKTTASDFGVEYASDYSGSKFSNFVVSDGNYAAICDATSVTPATTYSGAATTATLSTLSLAIMVGHFAWSR